MAKIKEFINAIRTKIPEKWKLHAFAGLNLVAGALIGILIFWGIQEFVGKNYVVIGMSRYTERDLAKEFPDVYRKLKGEYTNGLNYGFGELINKKLIEKLAKDKNTTPEELMNQGSSAYSPSETEIAAVYEQNKTQLKGKAIGEVKNEIIQFLKMQKSNDAKSAILNEAKEKYKSKISIHIAEPPAQRMTVEEKGNPFLGPKDAKVTVIEFSDFECPFCKRSQSVNVELRKIYKDKIKWVFRDYPLPFHQNAMFAHVAANCAIPQNKYWEYFNILFENTGNLDKENVIFLASKVGIDKDKLNDCIKNSMAVKSEIETDMNDGQKLGVNGTPAFFINGIMVEGAQPIAAFQKIIDKELNN
ncbi:MAG: thioredoxin domain-containing protein [Leptospira sp.]|nr:thioredoxin domain-containing protein [Leptospira sp.]